jgi:hypothetical protein
VARVAVAETEFVRIVPATADGGDNRFILRSVERRVVEPAADILLNDCTFIIRNQPKPSYGPCELSR